MDQAHSDPDREPSMAASDAPPPQPRERSPDAPTAGSLADPDRLGRLAEEAADDLGVDRVGFWLVEGEERSRLRRVHLYDRATGVHRAGGLLSAYRFPTYFRALRDEGELAVEQVESDPRVRELLTSYARPLEIGAWLDVRIRNEDGDTVGILRLELRGGPRTWSEGDRSRARKVAAAAGGGASGDAASGTEPPAVHTVALESNPAGIGILDMDGTVRRGNPALARALGFESLEELTGTNLVGSRFASERTWRGLIGRLEREDRVTDHEVELDIPGEDSPRWLLLAASLVGTGAEGEPTRVLTTVLDVTVRKQREMRLRHQAYRDPLTALANRRLLRETAAQTLALADRHGRTAGLLYLDLSGFKEVNDIFGHDVGDLVLVAVADRLRELVRESDLAARVGGDEFAVLLPEVEDEAGALRAGRRLLERLNRPITVGEEEIRVSGKAGIALYPRDGRDLDDLMRNADRAMYRTRELEDRHVAVHGEQLQEEARGDVQKETDDDRDAAKAGRGAETVEREETVTDPESEQEGEDDGSRTDLDPGPTLQTASDDGPSVDDLRTALELKQLTLHYQPIVRQLGEQAPGVEALLRWRHPERGLQDAASFLEEAGGSGLLPDIDRWALSRAVEQARRWSDAGLERWIAVNVSSETLAGHGLPAFLDRLVVDRGLRRELLLIDATLTADEPCLDAALPTLRNLRAKGFRVALDYSGPADGLTSTLGGAPVDVVKMDRAVLNAVSPETVTEMMDAPIVAKRIETEAHYEDVTSRGVSLLQGFFLGRPVPAGELDEDA